MTGSNGRPMTNLCQFVSATDRRTGKITGELMDPKYGTSLNLELPEGLGKGEDNMTAGALVGVWVLYILLKILDFRFWIRLEKKERRHDRKLLRYYTWGKNFV